MGSGKLEVGSIEWLVLGSETWGKICSIDGIDKCNCLILMCWQEII